MANTEAIYPKDLGLCSAPKKLTNQVVGRDIGSANPVILLDDSGENGGVIHSAYLIPLGANVASVFRLFLGSAGSYFLILEQSLPAINSASEAAQLDKIDLTLPPMRHISNASGLFVKPNCSLACGLGTAVSSGYNVILMGGSY